jgi:hypothetical protein
LPKQFLRKCSGKPKLFTVLEFGYEKVIPELVQQGYQGDNGMIETLEDCAGFCRDRSSNQTSEIDRGEIFE